MVRILGSTGTRRRRRYQLGALVSLVALLAVFAVPNALAVHDLDFQLDGDIDDSTTTNVGGNTQTVDWETLFDSAGDTILPLPGGFESAGFDKDFLKKANGTFSTADPSTFATGSKDTLPITPGWQCNQDNNVNSKTDVMNAYATSYTAANGDEILYFALERNANTGTGNVGFWFLQDDADCVSTGGTTAFSGDHTDGDILVVSEFSQGGTVSTIQAYRWDGGANGTLNPASVAVGADCTTTTGGDDICAKANTATLNNIPWETANKQDGVGHSLRTSEFFEGGINLTQTNLGGKCFNVFIGDTRSSTSLTATIFDFSRGVLGGCDSELVTDPSVDGSVSIGANASVSVTDNATLTVDGADEWSGTLSFFLCGPLAAGVTCDTGGVPSGSSSIDQDTVQPFTSDASTVTEVGRYCWRGEFISATDGVPDDTDASEGECFEVTPLTPTLTTSAGEDVVLGNPITDTATLTGTANQPGDNGGSDPGQPGNTYPSINADNGALANGTITFSLVGPDDCVSVPTGFTDIVVNVDGDSDADTEYTASFTPAAVGEYTWIADYSGDSPNTNDIDPTGCPDANEAVIVTGEAALSTAQDWLPNDTATITGPTALSGTATFTLFTGIDCGAGGDDNIVYGPVDVGVSGPSPQTAETANTTLVLEAGSGGYSWLVSYDDAVLDDPVDSCETTTITITD